VVVREGIEYRINRDHPLVTSVREASDSHASIDQLLRSVELSIPTDSLFADMASERKVLTAPSEGDIAGFLRDLAKRMVEALGSDDVAVARLLDSLDTLEPFAAHPQITRKTVEDLRDADR
jgi:hypothetical protein